MRSEGDYLLVSAPALFCRPNSGSSFKPIHFRHLHIHEHQIEICFAKRVDGLSSVLSESYAMASFFEQAQDKALVHRVVFRDQDAQHLRWFPRILRGVLCDERDLSLLLHSERAGNGFAKFGLANRLREAGRHTEFLAARRVSFVPGRGKHDETG